MNLVVKLKETSISVLPILLIVLLLSLTLAPIGGAMLLRFVIAGLLIILGLSLFLLGADIGVLPVGEQVGAALVRRRNLPFMLAIGFLVGFLITVAEPDVWILAAQAEANDASISRVALVMMIGVGVGLFVAIAFGRVVLGVAYRWMLLGFYALVFLLAAFTDPAYLGISFDAGGATTGPMTVPFIMALGVGVAAVRSGEGTERDSFGLVGLASIGPILAVVLMGIVNRGRVQGAPPSVEEAGPALALAANFLHLVPETAADIARALGPLVLMFVVFQLFLIKMPRHQTARMAKGLVYTFLGLLVFFVGVDGGFLPVGKEMGRLVGARADNWVLLPLGVVLGAVVVLAEPAIWVLNGQVEVVSGGHIKRRFMLAALSFGVAIAVGIAMLRVLTGLSLWWFLIPGYALALGLTFFCPPLFTAIAFDSGGVASGPMSSTFILSFAIGASAAAGGNPVTDAFGIIAMIAMMPLVAIQLLGILFSRKERLQERRKEVAS